MGHLQEICDSHRPKSMHGLVWFDSDLGLLNLYQGLQDIKEILKR